MLMIERDMVKQGRFSRVQLTRLICSYEPASKRTFVLVIILSFPPGMDPTLEEEFKNYDSRLEDQVRASRERLIKGCMAAHKKCLMDIDEAKNLCIVGFWLFRGWLPTFVVAHFDQ